jgi:hypothetical protein
MFTSNTHLNGDGHFGYQIAGTGLTVAGQTRQLYFVTEGNLCCHFEPDILRDCPSSRSPLRSWEDEPKEWWRWKSTNRCSEDNTDGYAQGGQFKISLERNQRLIIQTRILLSESFHLIERGG